MTSDRIGSALQWAAELHADQRRKGSDIPYLAHLLAVAALVAEHGADEDTFIAALLHDAAEDQGGEPVLREIGNRYGDRVAAIVSDCSDTFEDPKPPWRVRKEEHVADVRRASHDARLVIAADKLHNAQSIRRDHALIGSDIWDRFQGRRDGTLWYYDAMLEALADGWAHPILDELAAIIEDLRAL